MYKNTISVVLPTESIYQGLKWLVIAFAGNKWGAVLWLVLGVYSIYILWLVKNGRQWSEFSDKLSVPYLFCITFVPLLTIHAYHWLITPFIYGTRTDCSSLPFFCVLCAIASVRVLRIPVSMLLLVLFICVNAFFYPYNISKTERSWEAQCLINISEYIPVKCDVVIASNYLGSMTDYYFKYVDPKDISCIMYPESMERRFKWSRAGKDQHAKKYSQYELDRVLRHIDEKLSHGIPVRVVGDSHPGSKQLYKCLKHKYPNLFKKLYTSDCCHFVNLIIYGIDTK